MTDATQNAPIASDADALADALHACATTGVLIRPPFDVISLDKAYATQQFVFERRGARLGGWKLGITSELAQREMQLSHPVVGRLAASDMIREPGEVELTPGALYAEAELAVTLNADLQARAKAFGASEVASAIGEIHAAIELCTSRFLDDEIPPAALVADNALAYRLVLGRTLATGWDSRFASMDVALDCGSRPSIRGSTASVMGSPISAVTWLANWLSERGEGLKRGQIIATGSCTGVTRVHAGETVRVFFAGSEGAAITIVPQRRSGRSE